MKINLLNRLVLTLGLITLAACSENKQSESPQTPNETVIILDAKSGVLTGTADYGTFAHDAASAKLITFSLKNDGTEALSGPESLDKSDQGFSISYSNCSTSLAKGKTCTIKVAFDPRNVTAGAKSANLMFDTVFVALSALKDSPPAPPSVATQAQFQISNAQVSSVAFGEITQKESVVKTITVKNIGAASIAAQTVSLSGTSFSLSYDTCSGKALGKGLTCTIKVALSGAGKEGSVSSTLSYGDLTAELSGKVITPALAAADPNSSLKAEIQLLDGTMTAEASKNLGSFSGAQTTLVTLSAKNKGNLASVAAPVSLSDAVNFLLVYDTCSNKSLAANATCSVKVAFGASGKSAGSFSTTLSFSGQSIILNSTVTSSAPTCSGTQHLEGQVCVSNTKTCNPMPVGASAGLQTWNGTGYGACVISACNTATHHLDSGTCVVNLPPPTEIVQLTVSQAYSNYDDGAEFGTTVGNASQSEISFSVTPLSKTLLDPSAVFGQTGIYKYTFPAGTTSLTVSTGASSGAAFQYFLGDCSGTSCSLNLADGDSVKSVLLVYKHPTNKFSVVDLTRTSQKMCIVTGNNMGIGNNNGFLTPNECANPNKDVTWTSFSCEDIPDNFTCGTKSGCMWNSQVMSNGCNGMAYDQNSCSNLNNQPGVDSATYPSNCYWEPSYNNQDCSMSGAWDESSCTSQNSACSWSYYDMDMPEMGGYCMGYWSEEMGGNCNGTYYVDNGSYCGGGERAECRLASGDVVYAEEANCNSEALTGTYVTAKSTGSSSWLGDQSFVVLDNFLYIKYYPYYQQTGFDAGIYKTNLATEQITKLESLPNGIYSFFDSNYNGTYFFVDLLNNVYGQYAVKFIKNDIVHVVANGGEVYPNYPGSNSAPKLLQNDDGLFFIERGTNNTQGDIVWQVVPNGSGYKLQKLATYPTGANGYLKEQVISKNYIYTCQYISYNNNKLYSVNTSTGSVVDLNQQCSTQVNYQNSGKMLVVIDYDSNLVARPNISGYLISKGTVSSSYTVSVGNANSIYNEVPFLYNDSLYSRGRDNSVGFELFKGSSSGGVFGNLSLFADILPGGQYSDSSPIIIGVVNGKIIVSAYASPKSKIYSINPNNGAVTEMSSSGDSFIYNMYSFSVREKTTTGTLVNGKLYFAFNKRIYYTDGLTNTITPVSGFYGNIDGPLIKTPDNKLIFTGGTAFSGTEVWIYDTNP